MASHFQSSLSQDDNVLFNEKCSAYGVEGEFGLALDDSALSQEGVDKASQEFDDVCVSRLDRRRHQRAIQMQRHQQHLRDEHSDSSESPEITENEHMSNPFASLEALLLQPQTTGRSIHAFPTSQTTHQASSQPSLDEDHSHFSRAAQSSEATTQTVNDNGRAILSGKRMPMNPTVSLSTRPTNSSEHIHSQNSRKWAKQMRPTKRTVTTVTRNVKSIVGSRPKHWGNLSQAKAVQSRPQPQRFLHNREQRRATLAAELKRASSYRAKPTRLVRSSIESNPTPSTMASGSADATPVQIRRAESARCAQESDHGQTTIPAVTFAPAFVSSSKQPIDSISVDHGDKIAEGSNHDEASHLNGFQVTPWADGGDSRRSLSPNNSNFAWCPNILTPSNGNAQTPPVRRSSKKSVSKAMGPLRKRLKSLRDETKGDVIRLQSGQYPFSTRSVDRNDPRNRAKSVCDVTLVRNPEAAWERTSASKSRSGEDASSLNHLSLLPSLCFVHQWTSLTSSAASPGAVLGLAWVLFKVSTAREQSLVKGSKLRIYNAISIAHGPPIEGVVGVEDSAQWIILGTELCESYPAALTALADPPSLPPTQQQ